MASSTSILVHNNKILLILRDDKPEIPEPNTWQLPGEGLRKVKIIFKPLVGSYKKK